MGTFQYMAPSNSKERKPTRGDIFAFGCVL
jgi:hypothetical protein